MANSVVNKDESIDEGQQNPDTAAGVFNRNVKSCWNCGNKKHPRSECPAQNVECLKCKKSGHYARCCKSNKWNNKNQNGGTTDAIFSPVLATVNIVTPDSQKSIVKVQIKNHDVNALIDSRSSNCFIHPKVVKQLNLAIFPDIGHVSMASCSLSSNVCGFVKEDLTINRQQYHNQRFRILSDLCVDITLGIDFQSQHETVTLKYGRDKPSLEICG